MLSQTDASPHESTRESASFPHYPTQPRPRRAARLITRSLLVLSDFLAVTLAFYVAHHLRYNLGVGGDVEQSDLMDFMPSYLWLALVLGAIVVTLFLVNGLYRQQSAFWFNDFFGISASCGYAVMLLFAGVTMVRYPANSRLTFVYVWLLSTLLVGAGRLFVQGLTGLIHRSGFARERVVVIGDNNLARMVMQGISAQAHLGLEVAGFLAESSSDDFGRFRYLGHVEAIERVIGEHNIDQVIIALPSTSHELQLHIVEHCRRAKVRFKLVPDLYEMSLSRVDLDTISGLPLIDLREVSIEGWSYFLKRCLDLAVTALMLIPGGLLMAVIALAVRLDSPGPIIYRQTRVGKGGREFTIYKFRSMRDGAELEQAQLLDRNIAEGPTFKDPRDPRVTRVGQILRRLSLDELPLVCHVLSGEMSLVGPRPGRPHEVADYEPWQYKRLQVAPGLTGLWQVSGRSTLNFQEMVVFDLTYIQNWSLSLDLSILLRTIPAVIAGHGAF
jgi:exopolysaccharide biosynthesis polyprenyl glycosylphosphotransferase